MAAFFLYNIKFSVCLGVIYLFYYLALCNLTFYNWNRWFFLLATACCFLLPLINVGPLLENQEVYNLRIIQEIPSLSNLYTPVFYTGKAAEPAYPIWQFIAILFGLGVLVQGGRLFVQFVSFFRLRRFATRLQDGTVKIYQVNKNIAPLSFGNAIFLNKNLLSPAELQEIIRHELIHIQQKHTLDVLWLEFLNLINWYNPIVWLLKRAVRQNLEFIVDREILSEPHSDKKYYQYLLLKIIGMPDFTIANQFNISSLKTRINMMNRMPSKKRELGRFLLLMPMMALLIWACQDNTEATFKNLPKAKTNGTAVKDGAVPEAPPPPPAPPVPPAPLSETTLAKTEDSQDQSFTIDAFFQRNPEIKNFSSVLKDNAIVSAVVELKSGEKENYNFKNEAELALFQQRYGYFPIQNPPPPPPPVISTEQLPEDQKLFLKRHPQVENLNWKKGGNMLLYLKSGQTEEHDLKSPEGKARAERKYGKLPPIPAFAKD
ncbi:MAG: M56 family metallopeptidase [Adhaeribacter sp.]